jgi:hypothetical protein
VPGAAEPLQAVDGDEAIRDVAEAEKDVGGRGGAVVEVECEKANCNVGWQHAELLNSVCLKGLRGRPH